MIKTIKEYTKKIILTGTQGVTEEEQKKRIMLVNSLSLVLGLLIAVVGILFYLMSEQLSILIPASAELALTCSAIYLNHRGKYLAAALTTFLVQCAASVYFGLLLSNIIELQAMIIFLISIIYLLFKNIYIRRGALVLAVLILGLLETCYHYQMTSTIPLNIHQAFAFRILAMAGVLILIILVSKPYVDSNDLNQQLKRSNYFKKIFVYQVTHELRTPLNAIYGVAQLLKREIKLDERLKGITPLVDQLLAASNNTRNIVNNVLDMAQIESGNCESLSKEAFDLQIFLEKIVDVNRVIARTRNIRLQLTIQDMPQVIYCDMLNLSQIVTNLLGNAIKYADKNTLVKLEVKGMNDQWTMKVSNYGPVIPASKLESMFDPFMTDKSKYTEGTGLGLYIVKNKVGSMNGDIAVNSIAPGITTFTITLPLQAGRPEDIGHENEEAVERDLSDIHVIVAEDNEMNATLISRFLKQIGCSVALVTNGLEVLDEINNCFPDIIIMDYHMNMMDGKETLIHLQQDETLKSIPVIIATGDAFTESREELLAEGAKAFIEKPIDYKSLQKIIHQQLHHVSGELQE
ncbi:hybrid sensor histidine kinase/response regulator [Chitinophaga sp. 212800010-3]|uniref:ATP-binding response regulator n=1 Tax=unclassified Chitinophaga TaxID=2619133 RepID=UPI002DEEDB9B|nr:Signal transduction histidine kinase [Chitinophaga sp. 212800010-3]